MKPLVVNVRKPHRARQYGFQPHQGNRECRRRLRQVKAGALRGAVVTDSATYAAYGLIAPTDGPLVIR